MKLLRLVTVYIEPAPSAWRSGGIRIGSTVVDTIGSWDLNHRLRLLLVASVPLAGWPPLTPDGVVMVPEEPRREAEEAIKAYANSIAMSERARRSISSPSPYVAFLPETDDERTWLESTRGLKNGFLAVPGSRPRIELTDQTLHSLADRLDGLELCAEAQSQHQASGKFREFVRLFERAFRVRSKRQLVEPLWVFLQGSGQGFTEAEVQDWLEKKRHPVTHAFQHGRFLLESDIAPIIQRVEQAAYDVLFNKAQWGTKSTARRQLWSPEAGTLDSDTSLFLTQGKGTTIQFQVFDRLAGFPGDLSARLTSVPEEWWANEAQTGPQPAR